MKFSDLLDKQSSVGKLLTMAELPMPVKLRLSREGEKITKELRFFEQVRLETAKKYGRLQPGSKNDLYEFKWEEFGVTVDHVNEYNEEMRKLLDEEVKFEVSPVLATSELPEKNNLTPMDFQHLVGFLITDDTEGSKNDSPKDGSSTD